MLFAVGCGRLQFAFSQDSYQHWNVYNRPIARKGKQMAGCVTVPEKGNPNRDAMWVMDGPANAPCVNHCVFGWVVMTRLLPW